MLDRAAEEIARPWREMAPAPGPRESILVVALVALFVGSAVLCLGLIAPMVWTGVAGMRAERAYDQCANVKNSHARTACYETVQREPPARPKAALKPFGAILADQIGNRGSDAAAK